MGLEWIDKRVVVSVDVEAKNWHTFSDGTKIRLERQWNNLDKIHTEPVNATVISGENITSGSMILIHHNATHDTYRIFNHGNISDNVAKDTKLYSIPEDFCFAWYDEKQEKWMPMRNYDFGLRVFVPYEGSIVGVPPTQIKNVLYMTTGDYEGRVVRTLRASDFPIKFQGLSGQEETLIRCRPHGDKETQREPEATAIDHFLTRKVNDGSYHVGIMPADAAPILNEWLIE